MFNPPPNARPLIAAIRGFGVLCNFSTNRFWETSISISPDCIFPPSSTSSTSPAMPSLAWLKSPPVEKALPFPVIIAALISLLFAISSNASYISSNILPFIAFNLYSLLNVIIATLFLISNKRYLNSIFSLLLFTNYNKIKKNSLFIYSFHQHL